MIKKERGIVMLTKKNILVIVLLVAVAVFSFAFVGKYASSEENYSETYSSLDEKQKTVLKLTAVATASATAISLIPGDAGEPIANKLTDMTGYLLFILAAIFLETWLITTAGALAFKIIIPVCCLLLAAGIVLDRKKLRELSIKLICFALILVFTIPASVMLSNNIEKSHEEKLNATIVQAEQDADAINSAAEADENQNKLTAWLNKVKDGASGQLKKFENYVTEFTENIAVLIVTSCVIPLGVFLFLMWMVKLIFGININIPKVKPSELLKKAADGNDDAA
jgi:hypothetical protein